MLGGAGAAAPAPLPSRSAAAGSAAPQHPPALATPRGGAGRPPPCRSQVKRSRSPRGTPSPSREAAPRAPSEREPPAIPHSAPEEGDPLTGGPSGAAASLLAGPGAQGVPPLLSPLLQRRTGTGRWRRCRSFAVSPGTAKMVEASRGAGGAPRGAGLPPPRAGGQWQGWGGRSGSFCRSPERSASRASASRAVLALRLLRLPEPRLRSRHLSRGSSAAAPPQVLALRPRQRRSGRRALMNIYSERRLAPPPAPQPPISRARAGDGGRGPALLKVELARDRGAGGRCSVPSAAGGRGCCSARSGRRLSGARGSLERGFLSHRWYPREFVTRASAVPSRLSCPIPAVLSRGAQAAFAPPVARVGGGGGSAARPGGGPVAPQPVPVRAPPAQKHRCGYGRTDVQCERSAGCPCPAHRGGQRASGDIGTPEAQEPRVRGRSPGGVAPQAGWAPTLRVRPRAGAGSSPWDARRSRGRWTLPPGPCRGGTWAQPGRAAGDALGARTRRVPRSPGGVPGGQFWPGRGSRAKPGAAAVTRRGAACSRPQRHDPPSRRRSHLLIGVRSDAPAPPPCAPGVRGAAPGGLGAFPRPPQGKGRAGVPAAPPWPDHLKGRGGGGRGPSAAGPSRGVVALPGRGVCLLIDAGAPAAAALMEPRERGRDCVIRRESNREKRGRGEGACPGGEAVRDAGRKWDA
ncbi:PREDICTED: transcription initiation factor TFIID subunit 4-like [Lepidothrix coronata]|uniref:Transcription initiation factor TFIID subunit 4-like n=1 Tax=Lepidothrix coronata TaxID=321398 RepID=A0A6J0HNX6_9PASS|nr:PREDICTED: transcription initiation factor TFIID subunit 4-like [Lepidothrix coronata]